MYAVLVEGTVVYLGTNQTTVSEILKLKGPTAVATVVANLEELEQAIAAQNKNLEDKVVDGISQAATRLFKILEDSNLDNSKFKNQEKTLAQVRSLGIKEMRTVGEGFISLSDILAAKTEE